jgi:hypothetical protein
LAEGNDLDSDFAKDSKDWQGLVNKDPVCLCVKSNIQDHHERNGVGRCTNKLHSENVLQDKMMVESITRLNLELPLTLKVEKKGAP